MILCQKRFGSANSKSVEKKRHSNHSRVTFGSERVRLIGQLILSEDFQDRVKLSSEKKVPNIAFGSERKGGNEGNLMSKKLAKLKRELNEAIREAAWWKKQSKALKEAGKTDASVIARENAKNWKKMTKWRRADIKKLKRT